MKLGEFIEKFSHNNLIRLHYKEKGGNRLVLEDWNDVSMDWEVNKQKGKFPKSEDIRRRFARDVKDRLNYEVALLFGNKPTKSVSQGREAKLRRMKLRAWFKGKKLRAQLLKGGRVRFGGKVYESLSTAAAKACKRRTCNGWTFWKYLRAPGDWATVDHLRK